MLTNITLDNFGVISALPETPSVSIDYSVLVRKIQYVGQTLIIQQVAANNSLFLYPNPTNIKFKVSFGASTVSEINIDSLDMQCRKINQIQNHNNNYSVDTRDLLNGLCFININELKNILITSKKIDSP